MAAASRRKSLLQRSGSRAGDPGDGPADPGGNTVDPDEALEALEALEPDPTEEPEPTPAAATVATRRAAIDVVESQPAGTGFRSVANDDVWSVEEPDSEEVRLDPMFRRLTFRTPAPAPDAKETPATITGDEPRAAPPAPRPAARPASAAPPEPSRIKHGAVDATTSNRPGDTGVTRPPAAPPQGEGPAAPARGAPRPGPETAAFPSSPPQPQAAQDRLRSEPATLPNIFGTPVPPSGRDTGPDGPTLRLAAPGVAPHPASDGAGTEPAPAVPPAAGVFAVGGAALVSLLVAGVLLAGAVALGLWTLQSTPDAPPAPVEDAAPTLGATGPDGSDGTPDGSPDGSAPDGSPSDGPPPDAAGAPEEAVGSGAPAPKPGAGRRPRPRPEEPPPPEPAPAPVPVAAPAPPPPPPPPDPTDDEEDRKGRKRKKK